MKGPRVLDDPTPAIVIDPEADGEGCDMVLLPDRSAWVRVGTLVLYIVQHSGGTVVVEAFHNNPEDYDNGPGGEPLASFEVTP